MYACTCIIILFKSIYNFYDCIPIAYLSSHVFIFVSGHVMSTDIKSLNIVLAVKTKSNNKRAFLDQRL